MSKYPYNIDDNTSLPPVIPGTSIITYPQLLVPGGININVTNINSNYLIQLTDSIISVGTGPITITLPPSPSKGDTYNIKDSTGNASINHITISGNSHNIDGSSNYVMLMNYEAVWITFNGTQWMVL